MNDVAQHLRHTAIVLYFQPFETIRLDRMASAFGWSIEEVEQEVVALIQSGQIQGRVDSQNKVMTQYESQLARVIPPSIDPKGKEDGSSRGTL